MYVLDASAIIAFLRGEPGAEVVRDLLESAAADQTAAAYLSAVNLAEVVQELGVDLPALIGEDSAVVVVAPFDEEQARAAARMLDATKSLGLGLADRACLALASVRDLPAVTADRLWSDADVGVGVVQIR